MKMAWLYAHIWLTAAANPPHAVVRLGNQDGQAIVLGCTSDTELNAAALKDDNGRPFGWQLHSSAFSCKDHPSWVAAMSAECTYDHGERFIDFFFTSMASCGEFERQMAPHCQAKPAGECLDFMEQLLQPKPSLPSPI